MELRRVRLTDPEVRPLLDDLSAEYERRYGPGDEMTRANADEFAMPTGGFIVIVDEGETLAGGGIRRWSSDVGEVKRMWTAAPHRRRGYASAVLDGLEGVARDLGYTHLRVETGPAQPEAISLYRSRGYREIPSYGPYEAALAFETDLPRRED